MQNKKNFRLGLIIALLAFAADQAHKYIMLQQFGFIDGRMVEVTSFFNLVMVWNYGVSFGMMNNGKSENAIFLVVMTILVVSALFWWLKKNKSKYESVAIGLIIGGALGNALDRVFYGAVADFLDFHGGTMHWPAFNVADMCISTGVILLVLESFFAKKKA